MIFGEWQKCPVCNGAGSVLRPHEVPGDATQWSSSSVSHKCQTCGGWGIIPRPVINEAESPIHPTLVLKSFGEKNMDKSKETNCTIAYRCGGAEGCGYFEPFQCGKEGECLYRSSLGDCASSDARKHALIETTLTKI
jgi:hypothetical protein